MLVDRLLPKPSAGLDVTSAWCGLSSAGTSARFSKSEAGQGAGVSQNPFSHVVCNSSESALIVLGF